MLGVKREGRIYLKDSVANTLAAITLLLGAALILFCSYAFFHDFNPLELERSERTITMKHSELRQSLLPKYYVLVTDEFSINTSKQRVSKRDLFSAQIGDVISGYEKNGVFYTGRQLLSDITLLLVFTMVGLVLVLSGLFILWRKKAFTRKLRIRMRDLFLRMPRRTRESWKYMLLIMVLIWLFGGYVIHFFQIHFTTHQEVSAKVQEVEREPGYGRYNRPSYYLTFRYEYQGEPIIVETKVNKGMYDAYTEGSTATLWIKESNPYYAFPPGEVNASLKGLFGVNLTNIKD